MLIQSRILVLALSVLTTTAFADVATPVSTTPPPVMSGSAAVPVEPPVLLTDNFVQFERPNSKFSISILATAETILEKVKDKYYSLLSWKTHVRTQPAVVPKYKRIEQFGRWINDPNDDVCYNTRALVLMRDSQKEVTFADTDKCNVIRGNWKDDYTGQTFTEREEIQIDHLVPLKNAYMSGAYKWSFKARCLYANFLGYKFHLKSVNASQNMKKGDKAPDGYMPPNAAYTCTYLKYWLSVKFLWGLRMTESEASTISQILKDSHCNLSDYRISGADIRKQNKYVIDHIDLCDAVAPAAEAPTAE